MMTISGRLTVLVYFAIVLSPVLLLGHDGPWLGPGDISIRERAPFPKKLAPGAFEIFDQWFADHIGLRDPLIFLGTEFHVGALQRPLDRHIVFGRDGWMFWTDDAEVEPATMADSRGKLRFSPAETRRIGVALRALHDRLAACGIPGALFIAPNKQSIYGEHLVNAGAGALPSRLDVLLEALDELARSMIIDGRPALRRAKEAYGSELLYNKTETHWNDLGAYYGYAAIMAGLARTTAVPDPERMSLDNYNMIVEPYPGGDMATRVLFSPWRFPDADVALVPKQQISEPVQVDRVHFIQRNPNGVGRLVLFGDSFAIKLAPFLAQHFAEVHRYVADYFDGSIVARHRPDAVIFEMVERHAERLLPPPVGLSHMCDESEK